MLLYGRRYYMKDKINYTDILKKILNCLYVIIVFLLINSILLIVSIGTNQSNSPASSGDEQQEELPYDVSQFKEMTTDETMEAIGSSETQVIYIGRSGCGFCRRFIPVLQEAQKAYGYQTIYVDLDKVTSADVDKWVTLDEYVASSFGRTPFTILARDGQYVDGLLGYVEYDTFSAFLKQNGFQAQ